MSGARLRPGDRVRVRRTSGNARIVKFVRKHGVYLLDRKMTVKYPGNEGSVDYFVSYWTFPATDLIVMEK